jgi:hypothetical protein
MPQAVARIGRKGFVINSCASTCEAIKCDAGSRMGVILENRYSFRGRTVRIVLRLDGQRGRSFLLALDPQSFEEVGRGFAPHVIPFGFHGEFKS